MKHLFIVHSHITYLMSLAIVRYLNIKNDDVRILSYNHLFHPQIMPIQIFYLSLNENVAVKFKYWNYARYIVLRTMKIMRFTSIIHIINISS